MAVFAVAEIVAPMFRTLRIIILLFIFTGVALGAWRAKTQSVEWKYALPVNIYLINGDGGPVVEDYLRSLTAEDFKPIETFMRDEAERYGRSSSASIEIRLGGKIDAQPPAQYLKAAIELPNPILMRIGMSHFTRQYFCG